MQPVLTPNGWEVDPATWLKSLPRSRVELVQQPSPAPVNLLDEVVFSTNNVSALKAYLISKGVPVQSSNKAEKYLQVVDPEGHHIGFVEEKKASSRTPGLVPIWRVIHAGFIVRDRATEDRFYKDILGFRVYWHGGMKDGETNWVDMQVPDGTDWIEYMLNVPANADHHTRGVMNHIAIGVPDIQAAKQQLLKNGWRPGEEPKIGRGGKWQLNLYDPDETRVEFMEFTPVQKPCCSEYAGPHPGSHP
jgi:catechol 2,3-dioxygenase-like lactoylglutathione lyase family enzyme